MYICVCVCVCALFCLVLLTLLLCAAHQDGKQVDGQLCGAGGRRPKWNHANQVGVSPLLLHTPRSLSPPSAPFLAWFLLAGWRMLWIPAWTPPQWTFSRDLLRFPLLLCASLTLHVDQAVPGCFGTKFRTCDFSLHAISPSPSHEDIPPLLLPVRSESGGGACCSSGSALAWWRRGRVC